MLIFNKKNNNEVVNTVEELKSIQNEIKELVKERDTLSVPPLSNLMISERQDILDNLILILTGYYTIENIQEDKYKYKYKNKQLFLDTLKQIGVFLINFVETTEQYKNVSQKIKELKQKERDLKRKIGIE